MFKNTENRYLLYCGIVQYQVDVECRVDMLNLNWTINHCIRKTILSGDGLSAYITKYTLLYTYIHIEL